MSEPATQPPALHMPGKADLINEALARFDTAGLRSQILELDTQTLKCLGDWLTDRKLSVTDAHKRLCLELAPASDGKDQDGLFVVDYKAVHRFAGHFCAIYQQVRGEHARRIARLSVDAATAGNVAAMTSVAHNRLMELIAQKLVETDNLEELDSTELSAAIAGIDATSKGQIKQQELALKIADAERKTRKLESDLALAQDKLSALPEKIRGLVKRVDELAGGVKGGKKILPGVFASIRAELIALAPPAPAQEVPAA